MQLASRTEDLLGTGWVQGEEVEGFLLEWGESGIDKQDAIWCGRRGDFVAGEGGEVGEQAVEAADGQAVRGDASSVFVAPG